MKNTGKDYTTLKPLLSFPPSKEKELDEFLQDTELVDLVELMCKEADTELWLYIQFLLEKADSIPGKPRLPELVRLIIERARQERPWVFE